jgi:hypothetical protein
MADSPQEPHRHAGQVVRRVLRRNIAIDRAARRRRPGGAPCWSAVPAADCEPLF